MAEFGNISCNNHIPFLNSQKVLSNWSCSMYSSIYNSVNTRDLRVHPGYFIHLNDGRKISKATCRQLDPVLDELITNCCSAFLFFRGSHVVHPTEPLVCCLFVKYSSWTFFIYFLFTDLLYFASLLFVKGTNCCVSRDYAVHVGSFVRSLVNYLRKSEEL